MKAAAAGHLRTFPACRSPIANDRPEPRNSARSLSWHILILAGFPPGISRPHAPSFCRGEESCNGYDWEFGVPGAFAPDLDLHPHRTADRRVRRLEGVVEDDAAARHRRRQRPARG